MASLETSDLQNGIKELTRNVIKFQQHFLVNRYEKGKKDDGFDDYTDYDETIPITIAPKYLIPPYFYLSLDDIDSGWLDLNIQAINEAMNTEEPAKIAAQIVLERQLLMSGSHIDEIADKYNAVRGLETIFIWVDAFNETEVGEKYLKQFAALLKKFRGKKIINLYGGYYSLLLWKKGLLSGFCHGPGYGEQRGIKPVGGGIPTAKYYLHHISNRVQHELASSVLDKKNQLNEKYFSEVCNCSMCKELLSPTPSVENFEKYGIYKDPIPGEREIPTEDTLRYNQLHFLLKRFSDIKTVKIDTELKRFQEFIDWNHKMKIVSTQHLENWINAINE
jgi:hypothetical protein